MGSGVLDKRLWGKPQPYIKATLKNKVFVGFIKAFMK